MKRKAFTLLELQIAILLLAMGIVTLGSLMSTQSRLVNKLRGKFKPDATLYVTPSPDPWIRKLKVPARISTETLTLVAPSSTTQPVNAVEIVDKQVNLLDETITVTVDLTPAP